MSTRMQQRRGTASQWTNANPILAAGEIGFETDTNKFKIGDGVNIWADLSYFENLASLGGSFDDYIPLNIKGEPLGVAELDADGQVPVSQLGNVDFTGYATETFVNTAVTNLIDAAPGALDTLNELAAAIGDDASFFTTIGTDITNAENAAKSYADGLATNYDAAGAASTAETNANNYTDNAISGLGGNVTAVVNGNLDVLTTTGLTTNGGNLGVDFQELDTHYDALGAADSAETSANLYTDNSITTALTTAQGYADTAEADAKTYADGLAANYDAAGAATTAVSDHNLDTTNVHGIADTSALALTADVNTALGLKANIADASLTGTTSVEDLEISGALTFSGTATQIDSTSITLTDPMIYMGEGNNANINDLGFVASFDDGTYQHSGLVRDASAGTWKLFKGVTDEPTTTINFGQGSLDDLAVGSISATSATIGDVSNTELQYLNGVTSAVQGQLDDKAPIASPTFTGTVSGITASMVGLGNVDNTTDANKPVSTATQNALDLKANLAGPTFSGSVSLPQTTSIGDVSATEIGYVNGVTSGIQAQLDSKASTSYVDTQIAAIPAPDYTGLATETYADTAAANAAAAIVASAPAALDTLNELAAALGDDANFATTVTNAIATKAPTNAPTITNPTLNISLTSQLSVTAQNGYPAFLGANGGSYPDPNADLVVLAGGTTDYGLSVGDIFSFDGLPSSNGQSINNIQLSVLSANGTMDGIEYQVEAVNPSDAAALSTYSPSQYYVVPTTDGTVFNIVKPSSKTITPANIGHLDAPTITNPTFNVSLSGGENYTSVDEIINPAISGSFKISNYSAIPPFSVGDIVTFINSPRNNATIDGMNFEVVDSGFDNVFETYFVRVAAVNTSDNSTVDTWVGFGGGAPSGFSMSTVSSKTITPAELGYLDGVTSNIQDQINNAGSPIHPMFIIGGI